MVATSQSAEISEVTAVAQPAARVAMSTPTEQQQIADLFNRLARALTEHEGAALSDVFCADLMLTDADGRSLHDWDCAGEVFNDVFATEVPEWLSTCTVVRVMMVAQDVAVVNAVHDTKTRHKRMASQSMSTLVRRRGRWWIASLHSGPFKDVEQPPV